MINPLPSITQASSAKLIKIRKPVTRKERNIVIFQTMTLETSLVEKQKTVGTGVLACTNTKLLTDHFLSLLQPAQET